MASLADILATVQQGVTAANGLVKQMTGSLTNISGQLTGITSQISSINTQLAGFEAAWTQYTPTITAFSGTVVATSTGRFHQIGKTTFIQMNISVSSGGAGSGSIFATLPANPLTTATYVIPGREYLVTGKMLQGWIGFESTTGLQIVNYDNSYPASSGYGFALSGVYETT